MQRQGRVRQHTVARTHLLGFTDIAQQLTMRRRDGREVSVAVGNATVEKHFYTFVDDHGFRDVSIESWFADSVEGPAAGILYAAREGHPPTVEQRGPLSLYVAAMLMRNKLVRMQMSEIDSHIGPMVVLTDLLHQHHIDWSTQSHDERRQWWRRAQIAWQRHVDQRDPNVERRSALTVMLRKIDELAEMLSSWRFEVCDTNTDALITSDSAVAVIDPTAGPGWHGVLPDRASLAVPVSPRTLLLMTRSPTLGAGGTASATLAGFVNRNIAAGAFEAIFKHPDTTWPEYTTLNTEAPQLPIPTRTIRPSEPGPQPTFPATYPPVRDPNIRALLDRLGAVDQVN